MRRSRPKPATIHTLGYSRRSFDDVADLLRQAGIQIIADVRGLPASRFAPDFSKESLAQRLPRLGITYHHLKELGNRGRRALAASPNAGLPKVWQPFADYMLSREFERGLMRLEALAAIGPVAMLCAEKDWEKCHRRFVADALTARGFRVVHLGGDGPGIEHVLTPGCRRQHGRLTYPSPGRQLHLL